MYKSAWFGVVILSLIFLGGFVWAAKEYAEKVPTNSSVPCTVYYGQDRSTTVIEGMGAMHDGKFQCFAGNRRHG